MDFSKIVEMAGSGATFNKSSLEVFRQSLERENGKLEHYRSGLEDLRFRRSISRSVYLGGTDIYHQGIASYHEGIKIVVEPK